MLLRVHDSNAIDFAFQVAEKDGCLDLDRNTCSVWISPLEGLFITKIRKELNEYSLIIMYAAGKNLISEKALRDMEDLARMSCASLLRLWPFTDAHKRMYERLGFRSGEGNSLERRLT